MPTPRFKIEVKDGYIKWPNSLLEQVHNYLLTLGDGEREMILQKPHKPKSDAQRSYYWGVIVKMIADDTGMSELEVHEYCKYKFLPYNVHSTEDLTTTKAEEYYQKIRTFAATELNILIPLPNEVLPD